LETVDFNISLNHFKRTKKKAAEAAVRKLKYKKKAPPKENLLPEIKPFKTYVL
jgi:hypothetical protein